MPAVATVVRWIGYAALILALPIVLFTAAMLPNEYTAMGLGGVDCDGPDHVFIFAYPAFAIYGIAAIVNLAAARKRRNLIVAGLCLLVCVVITPNFVAALDAQRDNDSHHLCE